MRLYFDGACLPYNPGGIATYGYVIYDKYDNIIAEDYNIITEYKKTNNNIAEYVALIKGLEKCLELGIKKINVFGDSQLVIYQSQNIYKCKSPNLYNLYNYVQHLKNNFKEITLTWIKRDKNIYADYLSKKAYLDYSQKIIYEKMLKMNNPTIIKINNYKYKVNDHIVDLYPNINCTCKYFQKMNNYVLVKKENIIIKCKHILYLENMLAT